MWFLVVTLLHALPCGSRTKQCSMLHLSAAAVGLQLVPAATASAFRSCDIGAISCPEVEEQARSLDDGSLQPSQRTLQQQLELVGPEVITFVTTPTELIAALANGKPRLEIRAHLDLRQTSEQLLSIHDSTISITGNCTGKVPPRAPDSGIIPAGHCMISVHGDFLLVQHSLWLHNLFFLQQGTSRNVATVRGPDANLWMTDVTLEENNTAENTGEQVSALQLVSGASMYAQGCTITEFEVFHVVSINQGGGSASFVNCTFTNNSILEDWTNLGLGFGVIHATVRSSTDTVDSAQVKLQGCTFSGNSPGRPLLVADKRGTPTTDVSFFGDESAPQVCTWHGDVNADPDCVLSNVIPIGSSSEGVFLTDSDGWLASTKQGLYYTPPQTRQQGFSDQHKQQLIAGAACVAVVILIVAAVELMWHRQNQKRQEQQPGGKAGSSEKALGQPMDRWDAMAAMNIA